MLRISKPQKNIPVNISHPDACDAAAAKIDSAVQHSAGAYDSEQILLP